MTWDVARLLSITVNKEFLSSGVFLLTHWSNDLHNRMLTDKEKEYISELMKLMPDRDIYLLSLTVTNNMIVPETVQEAIDAIILHSATPESLLTRKKLSKDILFKYLNKNKVPVLPSADKKSMIDSILQMWGCASNNNQPLKSPVHDRDSAVVGMKPANATSGVGEIDEMARQFTSWFYSMLNQHEVMSQESGLGIEHFWQDCNMCLVIQSEIDCIKHEVQNNAADVVQLLCSTKIEHNLRFNPNMSCEGVQGKTDAHGLVMIIVCGTLHQQDRCVGVFEQLFGLIRDPSACNNWKIKYTNVILKSKSLVTCLPTLAEGNFLKSITAPPNSIQL